MLLKGNRFTLFISQKLDRYPSLKKGVSRLYYRIWRFELKIRSRNIAKTLDPNKTYLVNPNRIVYAELRGFNIFTDKAKVIGGDWDLPENRTRFEDLGVHQAFCARFLNHKNWEETEFYHRVLASISDGQIGWGCRSREQFDDRCKGLDRLYQNIRDNGYQTQRELGTDPGSPFESDEITVSVARTGELLFTNGAHRLSIVKILGLKEVPIKVTVRHSEWAEFRKQILSYAEAQGGKVYQSLTHPDLSDIPSFYGDERFKIIKQNLSVETGTLLDIGAHWGYFCHKFEDKGFDCYAVESNPANVYFLNKLKQAENKEFKVFHGSIFDYRAKTDFDVVLALNIFHHFLKGKDSYLKLVELLERLKMRELFFEPAKCDEPQMKNAYKNYSPDDFVAFILEHSCLKEARHIGESQNGRPLYKLYR